MDASVEPAQDQGVSFAPAADGERALFDQGRTFAPLTSLIGRETDIAAIRDELVGSETRLLTLLGPGGVGKTRLADRVAAEMAELFADGVDFVSLAAISSAVLVLPTIAHALGLREEGGGPVTERLREVLHGRHRLLVLDNFEKLRPAAPAVANLVAACPRLVVMVTSRARLNISVERIYHVQPLAVPPHAQDGVGPASMEEIAAADAVRLFVARAGAVEPSFALTADNALATAAICRRLDGLPLAIELAAARLRVLSPSELLARLDRALPLLTDGPRDAPDRLRTMRQAIAWSFNLLDPADQTVFCHLGLFTGGFTLIAAEAMIAAALAADGAAGSESELELELESASHDGDGAPHTGKTVVEHLASLVDTSLLQQRPGPNGVSRYVMLETVREFALEHLAARGEETAAADAHAAYYLALAEQEAPDPCRHRDLVARLELFEAEHANLRRAIGHLAGTNPEAALRLAGQLAWFWYLRSHLSAGRSCLEQAIAAGASAPPAVRSFALAGLGQMSLYQGDLGGAEEAFAHALALAYEANDRFGIAYAVQGQGVLAMLRGDFAAAVRLGLESAAHYESAGDLLHTTVGRFIAARALHYAGDLAEAEARFQAILTDFAGFPYNEALARANLADVAARLGQHHVALTHYAAALELLLALGERWNVAKALEGIAGAFGELGKPRTAARLLGAAASLRAAIGTPPLPADLPEHERLRATLILALGGSDFADAFAAGQMLSPDIAVAAAVAVAHRLAPEEHAPAPVGPLSPREKAVLRLVAQGWTDKEIAASLSISHRTVSAHVAAVLAKLDVPSRSAAVAIATRDGLV